MTEQKLTYNPSIFDVRNLGEAKGIILTPEGSTTEHRWEVETPYVAELIGRTVTFGSESVVLDYGCGIGRMSRELIARSGCRVIGIDISQNMRSLAPGYVQSDRFFACAPAMFDLLVEHGLRVDAAISIWVLQHCFAPADDIGRIRRALRPGGGLFVLNNIYRAVPTREKAWVHDGIDIRQSLAAAFELREQGMLPAHTLPEAMQSVHFWASFRVP
jgi:SAM-dependent methyltransferase